MPDRQAALRALIESHEGRVNHLYVDTEGNVTAGVGHLVPSPMYAAGLKFWHEGVWGQPGPNPANQQEIEAEFARCKALPIKPNKSHLASLFMRDDDITALLDADLKVIHSRVLHQIPDLDALPDNAYLASMDIAFNCGSLVHWPHLVNAIHARNWELASRECFRPQVGAERNETTAKLFASCLGCAA